MDFHASQLHLQPYLSYDEPLKSHSYQYWPSKVIRTEPPLNKAASGSAQYSIAEQHCPDFLDKFNSQLFMLFANRIYIY